METIGNADDHPSMQGGRPRKLSARGAKARAAERQRLAQQTARFVEYQALVKAEAVARYEGNTEPESERLMEVAAQLDPAKTREEVIKDVIAAHADVMLEREPEKWPSSARARGLLDPEQGEEVASAQSE